MANSSFSSSLSFDEPLGKYTEEQEMALYMNIKMNLQAIEKATNIINLEFKSVQEKIHVTTALTKAIESALMID